jgi:hypothetical protein
MVEMEKEYLDINSRSSVFKISAISCLKHSHSRKYTTKTKVGSLEYLKSISEECTQI